MSPQTFIDVFNQVLPEPQTSLLAGMIFGVKTSLPQPLYQALRTTGTVHIVALSGTNISILIGFFGALFFPGGRRISAIAGIACVALFVWFVGPSASVVRAAIMGSLTLLANFSGRKATALLSLVVTAVIMLTVWPQWLFDIGFQLSFAATAGILVFSGRRFKSPKLLKSLKSNFLNGFIQFVWADLVTTLSAQVFTLPIIFMVFHQISIVAPLTNVLIGWTVPIITILGFIIALLGLVFLPAAQVLAWVIYPFLDYCIGVIMATSALPFAAITFNP